MLQGIIPVRLAPVGGGLSPPKYNMLSKWRVKPVPINATIEEVRVAVKQ